MLPIKQKHATKDRQRQTIHRQYNKQKNYNYYYMQQIPQSIDAVHDIFRQDSSCRSTHWHWLCNTSFWLWCFN